MMYKQVLEGKDLEMKHRCFRVRPSMAGQRSWSSLTSAALCFCGGGGELDTSHLFEANKFNKKRYRILHPFFTDQLLTMTLSAPNEKQGKKAVKAKKDFLIVQESTLAPQRITVSNGSFKDLNAMLEEPLSSRVPCGHTAVSNCQKIKFESTLQFLK